MHKFAKIHVIILLFPLLLNAGHVFIWNYDTLDVFYDSQVGNTINCAYWLEQTLADNDHTYTIGHLLPTSLDPYDAVLVSLGWYRC